MAKNTISDLTKKIDINNIVKGVKSMISPTGMTPDVDEDDALGVKLAQISTLVQSVANIQTQQTKEFAKINKLVNDLYADIEKIRSVVEENAKSAEAVDADEDDSEEVVAVKKPKAKAKKAAAKKKK
jgi:formyltetrahydrofolate synthetase